MKILRYYPRAYSGDGGITNSVRRISAASSRAGASVTVAVDEAELPVETFDGFRWAAVPHRGSAPFRRPVNFGDVLRGSDVLVLHSAWTTHNLRAGEVARRLGVPYVLEPRGAYDPRILDRRPALKRLWWWAGERRLVQGAAAVHAFFPSQQEHLARIGYRGPVIVAPNGVAPPAGVQWDGGSGGYVLWFGRFDPEHKGLDLLLRGLALLPEEDRPTLRLRGPDWAGGKERVRRLVRELGLAARVEVGDPVYGDEKWRLLASAAAFTYPSQWEGFGNSAAEAVAVGVPTLVTPYPLGRWLEQHGAAVAAEATPEGLAQGLRTIVSPEARALGRRGREVVREHLSWDAVARAWLDQVRAVL